MAGTVVSEDVDPELVALASLDQIGPARLTALLRGRTPAQAWDLVRRGDAARVLSRHRVGTALAASWARQAASLDVDGTAARHAEAGVAVVDPRAEPLAERFVGDPAPPAVLFARGDLSVVSGPSVAIVGTRDCTPAGAELAHEWAGALARAGVSVVSGLALGIDGAAHAGALMAGGAPPIGVVGTGLDVVYPREHRRLWSEVCEHGLLLSEHPLGTRPRQWQFPARNRIIAALGDLTVVIESHAVGGSLHTVEQAVARNREVMSVPGSVRSPASAGTNALLFEGCGMARDVDDVLLRLASVPRVAGRLGLVGTTRSVVAPSRAREPEPEPDGEEGRVLDALGWEPASLEQVLLRTGLAVGVVAAAVDALEARGLVRVTGSWFERRRPEPGTAR